MTEMFHILMWALATRRNIIVKTYHTVHLRLVTFFYMKFIPNVRSFFLFKIYSSLFLAALGPRCHVQAFSGGGRGSSPVVLVASLAVGRRV